MSPYQHGDVEDPGDVAGEVVQDDGDIRAAMRASDDRRALTLMMNRYGSEVYRYAYAELLLPAGAGKVSSKEPMQELLERASAAGLGLVLASQSPADLDYRRCASIDAWFLGKTDDRTLKEMKALFERRPLGHRNPGRLEPGRFVMLHDRGARDVERRPPLLRPANASHTRSPHCGLRTAPSARRSAGR